MIKPDNILFDMVPGNSEWVVNWLWLRMNRGWISMDGWLRFVLTKIARRINFAIIITQIG